jgi:hypothetical protein
VRGRYPRLPPMRVGGVSPLPDFFGVSAFPQKSGPGKISDRISSKEVGTGDTTPPVRYVSRKSRCDDCPNLS